MTFATVFSPSRLTGRLRSAVGDARGVTSIEFAIVAVPFFGLILLILQIGLFHFSLQSLDFAVRQAGRTVMTGKVASSVTSASAFRTTYICPNVFWAITCNNLVINSYVLGKTSSTTDSSGVYAYINNQTKSLNDPKPVAQQTFCLGAAGDYVYLDVAYPYPNFVRKLLSATAADTWQMRSSTVIYNEPSKKSSGASC